MQGVNKKKRERKSKLKPYYQCGRTIQSVRRRELISFAKKKDCPLSALSHKVPAVALLHLHTRERNRFRTVSGIQLASEREIVELKKNLALSHGTGTASSFLSPPPPLSLTVAYLTDPIKFLRLITKDCEYLTIGGDTGGDSTKLGVSYTNQEGRETFAPLLISSLKDNYEGLEKLKEKSLYHFTGESIDCKCIWDVFQSLIDRPFSRKQKIFLSGDWLFTNAVLGLLGPGGRRPCPICLVHKNNLLTTEQYRQPDENLSNDGHVYPPLLRIQSSFILPTPLHVYLGLGNRIIKNALPHYVDVGKLEQAWRASKSVYSTGCSGRSTLDGLNGPELDRFIQLSPYTLIDIQDNNGLTCLRWIKQLHDHLLHKSEWTAVDISSFSSLVDEMWSQWSSVTHDTPFPKLHMLRHCVEFADRHRYLGRFSEAQLESYHSTFNHATQYTHRNQGDNLEEKYRRSLADRALQLVQPLLS